MTSTNFASSELLTTRLSYSKLAIISRYDMTSFRQDFWPLKQELANSIDPAKLLAGHCRYYSHWSSAPTTYLQADLGQPNERRPNSFLQETIFFQSLQMAGPAKPSFGFADDDGFVSLYSLSVSWQHCRRTHDAFTRCDWKIAYISDVPRSGLFLRARYVTYLPPGKVNAQREYEFENSLRIFFSHIL